MKKLIVILTVIVVFIISGIILIKIGISNFHITDSANIYTLDYDINNIDNMVVNAQTSNVEIIYLSSAENIEIKFFNALSEDYVKYELETNSLIIKTKEENLYQNYFYKFFNKSIPNIVITIPESIKLNKMILDISVSSLNADIIKADILAISSHVSKINIDKTISSNIDIYNKAGDIDIKEVFSDNFSIINSTGNANININSSHHIGVDNKAGKVNLSVIDLDSYSFDLENNVGKIGIGKNDFSSVNGKYGQYKNGNRLIYIKNSLGNVEIN